MPNMGGTGNVRLNGGPMGGKRPAKRVYPLTAKNSGRGGSGATPSSHVGGFAGGGQGCRPSPGALLCFFVGFIAIIVSVVITAYAILSNEKNSFGMAIAINNTVFYRHISQTQPSSSAPAQQARVGIHNADPQATLEITTHGGREDVGTTLRLSRLLTADQADDDTARQMKSSLEFGYYAVDPAAPASQKGTWVQGARVSSDMHTGSLYMTSGFGSPQSLAESNRSRRALSGEGEYERFEGDAEAGVQEHDDEYDDEAVEDVLRDKDVWDKVDAGLVSDAAATLQQVSKMRGRGASASANTRGRTNTQRTPTRRRRRQPRRQLAAANKCTEGSLFLNAQKGACGDVSIAAGGGNVGIGVEAPGYPLDIAGNVYSSGTIKMGGSIQLGKMTITNGTTAAGLQACKVPGEVRYTTDEFYGCTKDRGWVPLTATFHSQYNGTLGQMAYFVGPTGQTGSTGIHWKDKHQEFRLQSQHESEPTTKVSHCGRAPPPFPFFFFL